MDGHDIPDSLPDGFGDKPEVVKGAIERASARVGPIISQITNSDVKQAFTRSFEIGTNLAGVLLVASLLSFLAWILR